MNDADEYVVLVDDEDRPIGIAPKLRAHIEGLRHRAVSVLVVNSNGELLLQRRHSSKYHSG
jgi:isopentenyl-diphosphate delta-isomerase